MTSGNVPEVGDPALVDYAGDQATARRAAEARIDELNELLAAIWLYVDWNHVTKQLTTRQKDLWADAIDGDERDFEMKVDRWWADR